MNKLLENINSLNQIKQIENNINDYSPIYLSGLTDGFKPHLVLALFEKFEESMVIIAENEKRAEKYFDSINGIKENQAYLYPSLDINFYNIKSIDNKKLSQRMEVLTKLAKGDKFIVITTLKAITNKLSTLDRFNKSFVKIKDEDIIDVNNFIENLINLNYTANSLVENKGDFAKRGSIIDFWPVSYDNPIRIELFDDEVDSIRLFDKDSQRTLEKISEVEISPVTELIYSKEDYDKAIKNINREIEALEKKSNDVNSQKLIDKYKQIASFIEESMFVSNIDLVNPYRKDNFSNFLDYVPKSGLIFFDDIARILEDYDNFYGNFLEDLSLQMENNEIFRSFEDARIPIVDIYEQLSNFKLVNLTSILKKSKLFNPRKIIELKTIESENFNRRVDYFIDRTIELANSGKKILILESNEKTASQLIEAYLEKDYTQVAKVDTGENFEKIPIQIANAASSSGYYIYDLDFYVFTHKDIWQ